MSRIVRLRHRIQSAYPSQCFDCWRTDLTPDQALHLATVPQPVTPTPRPNQVYLLIRFYLELLVTAAFPSGVTYNFRYRPASGLALTPNFTLQETTASLKMMTGIAQGATFFSQSPPNPPGRAIELYTLGDLAGVGGAGAVGYLRTWLIYAVLNMP